MPSISNLLAEMETLLRRHDFADFADRLSVIGSTQNSIEFAAQVQSLDIWGGTGSIVDVTLGDPFEERRFNELIVDLAEALDQLGIGTPRSRWVGQTIEDWLIAHPTI